MKNLLILLLAFLTTTCASTNLDKNMNDFEELIRAGKDVYIENKTFKEAVDFTKILPPNPVNIGSNRVRIVSSVTFMNCTFESDVIAYSLDENGNKTYTSFQSNLSFIGCTFNGSVNFRSSTVLGRVVFSGSYFEKTANFEECSFQQLTHFNKCAFHEELRFQNTFFMQRVNFINAEFDANVSFQGSTFNSTAQFSNTRFIGYADFSMINWRENVFFNYAEIADRSVFNSSRFSGIADFLSVTFGNAEMINCEFFGELSLTDSKITNQLKFINNYFLREKPDLSFFESEKLIAK